MVTKNIFENISPIVQSIVDGYNGISKLEKFGNIYFTKSTLMYQVEGNRGQYTYHNLRYRNHLEIAF